jgi:hypothetical protein
MAGSVLFGSATLDDSLRGYNGKVFHDKRRRLSRIRWTMLEETEEGPLHAATKRSCSMWTARSIRCDPYSERCRLIFCVGIGTSRDRPGRRIGL